MKLHKYKWYDPVLLPILCTPMFSVLRILLMIATDVLPVIQVGVSSMLINRAIVLLQVGTWNELRMPLVLLGGIIFMTFMGQVISDLLEEKICCQIRKNYGEFVIRKCASLPYAKIEEEKGWNLICRIKESADKKILKGFKSYIGLIGIAIQTIGILLILFHYVWWLAIIITVISIVVMQFAIKSGETQYEVEKDNTTDTRLYHYIGDLLVGRDNVGEKKIFNYVSFLQNKWGVIFFKAKNKEKKVVIDNMIRMKMISILMSSIMFIAALFMIPFVTDGRITVGLYIALVQAIGNLTSLMSWDLADDINDYSKYKEYVKDVVAFYNLPEIDGARSLPNKQNIIIEKIEFKNVSFRYPNTEKLILNHISFTLEKGKHYSLVGTNGAGKTTLIKLIIGLYSEFEGEIFVNEKSIREYRQDELKAMYAVLFQDYACYEISIRDNIALGDIRCMDSNIQDKRIKQAINLLELDQKIESLPMKEKTKLGKLEYGGEHLSGGEEQRIAMARVVNSPASMLILDEPTAALDPISESKLYEQFDKISKDRTTIFISHRLGSTWLADEIIVMNQGNIVQQGTHMQLMKECELYKTMYEEQRSWYNEM